MLNKPTNPLDIARTVLKPETISEIKMWGFTNSAYLILDRWALNCPDEKGLMKGLKSASGFLRRELGHALQLRYTPELQFIADDSIAYGAHILEVLRDPKKVKPVNPDNDAVLPEEE